MISGTSLTELLVTATETDRSTPAPTQDETSAKTSSSEIDPDCEKKIKAAHQAILRLMQQKRPRFVPAFEQMEVVNNEIRLKVPTQELREEILRNQTAILLRIAELAEVSGTIQMEITVNEEIRASRPIKLEDRIKYITDKNPLVNELCKALDLEVE